MKPECHEQQASPVARILKIGKTCNNRCYFCFERGISYETDAVAIESQIKNRGACEQLIFTGQEPTLLQELPSLAHRGVACGYKVVQVVSNGRMFAYKNFAQEMIRSGMTELLVCLHSHKSDAHDRVTNAEKSHLQAIRGIANVIEFSNDHSPFFNVEVVAGVVVTPENYRDLESITRLAHRLGIRQIFFLKMRDYPGDAGFSQDEPWSLLEPALAAARELDMAAMLKGFARDLTAPEAHNAHYEHYIQEHPVILPETPVS